MKISELREMVESAVKQALLESAFEQYDEAAVIPEGRSLEDKMKEALVIALQCADALLKKTGDRSQYIQKAVSLFLDENGDFSDPDADEDQMEAWMEHELPAMSYREGYDNRVKNVAINIVGDIISSLRKMNAPSAGGANHELYEQEESAEEHFYKQFLPGLAQSVLVWAEKGQTFLKVKLVSIASRYGIDPGSFADELEQLTIKAWEEQNGTPYDPADRLSGVHGDLGVVQAVLDGLKRLHGPSSQEVSINENRYHTPNFFTHLR